MDYILTTNALTKQYKQSKALNGLSMHVPKGAIYGFVGKNGAGKTTLIRLICGLQEPTSGSYTLYGVEDSEKNIVKSRRRMGAVVETPSVYFDMTAEDNLKEQYRILGIPSFDGIPELLKLVGLENTGKKKAKNFSLGMKQRLGIAIALAGDPDFLVLDEPTNGLDPQGIIEIRELILKLNREHQITVLISSHILDELSRLATHYGIATAALISFFVGDDFSDGVIRNKVIAGRSRSSIYLSNLICGLSACLLVYTLTILVTVVIGSYYFENDVTPTEIFTYFVLGLFTCMAFGSIFCMLSMLIGNKSTSIMICMCLAFGMLCLCLHTNQILLQQQYKDGILNSHYIGGTKRIMYEFLHDINPFGQIAQLSAMTCLNWKRWICLDILWIGVAVGLGNGLFRRKNIR